jgi:hypothetical protein
MAMNFLDLIEFYFCVSLLTRKMSAHASAQASGLLQQNILAKHQRFPI